MEASTPSSSPIAWWLYPAATTHGLIGGGGGCYGAVENGTWNSVWDWALVLRTGLGLLLVICAIQYIKVRTT